MEVLKQRMNYFIITLMKNYSKISDKTKLSGIDENRIDENYHFFQICPSFPRFGKITQFSSDKSINIPIEYAYKKTINGVFYRSFYTTNERHLKKHYPNPFANVCVITIERTIRVENDKIYIKCFTQYKQRHFNAIYFKKTITFESITFDFKTGNITVGNSTYMGKHKNCFFRKNNFEKIESIINTGVLFNLKNHVPFYAEICNKFNETMDDNIFVNMLLKELGVWEDNWYDFNKNQLYNKILGLFVEIKKIKTPNCYHNLISRYYPTEKYLKKNDRKLVQSILDRFGINSKIVIKIVHENLNFNILEFSRFCKLFGIKYTKYVGSLNKMGLSYFSNNFINPVLNSTMINNIRDSFVVILTPYEKESIIRILNTANGEKNIITENVCYCFNEHFNMIEKIREYYPEIRMKARTYYEYVKENSEFIKIITLINNGWSIEYIFDNRMVRTIENEIKTIYNNEEYTFVPLILKRNEDFYEEGKYMHHCVNAYLENNNSLIISLRVPNRFDRITCEFDRKTGECKQSRYFCNKIPPEFFNESLNILKDRVKKFSYQRLLDPIEKIKVRAQINGKEVKMRPKQTYYQLDEFFNDF